jgi:hypothetical protein
MAKNVLRKSARGQECQVRLYQICKGRDETVVLAHLGGGGVGGKGFDIAASFCCFECHQVIDFAVKTNLYTSDELRLAHLQGVMRTQSIWIKAGLLKW